MRKYTFKEINNIYGKISPFEFKDMLISLAKFRAMECGRRVLDAGRGNPNWTAATPREAFFTFGHFAVSETRRTWNENDLAGMPTKGGTYHLGPDIPSITRKLTIDLSKS